MKIAAYLLATFILTVTAQASARIEKETILCKGIDESTDVSFKLEATSNSNIEGKAIAYFATLVNKAGEKASGIIFGYKNDVMLTLKPKGGDSVQVSGTIYMDDDEQQLDLDLGNDDKIDLKLSCNVAR